MNDQSHQRSARLTGIESFAVSTGFWLTLIAASLMYALLILAPTLVENIELRNTTHRLEAMTSRRVKEVAHLSRLAEAIERDEDFVARMRGKEFSLKRHGTVEIAVSPELGFDARVPQVTGGSSTTQTNWHDAFLRKLSSPTELKRNWSIGMLILFLFAFLVMNENFFANNWGKAILEMVSNLFQRYRVPPTNVDDEGCQRAA